MMECQRCHGTHIVKHGSYLRADGTKMQNWQCRDCGKFAATRLAENEALK